MGNSRDEGVDKEDERKNERKGSERVPGAGLNGGWVEGKGKSGGGERDRGRG
jgi:hypothetical protein